MKIRRLASTGAALWLLLAGPAALATNLDGSCPVAGDGVVASLASDVHAAATTAPDGYSRNAETLDAPRSLAEAAAQATARLDVPYRVQEGPTCGLYALGMVMDYYHQLDASNATPYVQPGDDTRYRASNFRPSTKAQLFDTAKRAGYFAESQRIVHKDGGMFVASQLGDLAGKFGYRHSVIDGAGASDIRAVIDRGHPALVGFDVDQDGNPTEVGGARAHWAVITGHFSYQGEEYFIAHHGWEARDFIWRAADLEASMKQIQPTLGPKVVEVSPRTH